MQQLNLDINYEDIIKDFISRNTRRMMLFTFQYNMRFGLQFDTSTWFGFKSYLPPPAASRTSMAASSRHQLQASRSPTLQI
ncbi:hypothetical protein DAI22_08g104401 [Oryza sativa Japonica Group]|nr:hypothetical protein DAI22_08g104401 [Oryza sativa Japonica Group]